MNKPSNLKIFLLYHFCTQIKWLIDINRGKIYFLEIVCILNNKQEFAKNQKKYKNNHYQSNYQKK